MIQDALAKVTRGATLDFTESHAVMTEIMDGSATTTQIAGFLAAFATRNQGTYSIDEISGFASAMREKALNLDAQREVFEIVGTGGDNSGSFNISTTSAIIAASGGMKVAKHGNKAASSKCGAADCLTALGVNVFQSPKRCVELLDKVGICFFFAQMYHESMKRVAPIRKELGVRTIFNLLGPLTNPAKPTTQLLGTYDPSLNEFFAQALSNLGVKRGMVVSGRERLDEISLCGATAVCELNSGTLRTYDITPEEFGFTRCAKEDLLGGSPQENARITLDILNGKKGPKRNATLMNAGASLYLGGKAESVKEGIALAEELVDSGKALDVLNKFIEISNLPEETI